MEYKPGHHFFFKWLTEEEQEKLTDNIENLSKIPIHEYLMRTFYNHKDFINDAFTWNKTPEKETYWRPIYNREKPLIE